MPRPKQATATSFQTGAGLYELTLIIILLSIFVLVAIDRVWRYRISAEEVGVAHVEGAIRSALGIEVATRVAQGRVSSIAELHHSNPIQLLTQGEGEQAPFGITAGQPPHNYLGELDEVDEEAIAPGNWYFNRNTGTLVYRVLFEENFETELEPPARINFRLERRYNDINSNGHFDSDSDQITGIYLTSEAPYRWILEE